MKLENENLKVVEVNLPKVVQLLEEIRGFNVIKKELQSEERDINLLIKYIVNMYKICERNIRNSNAVDKSQKILVDDYNQASLSRKNYLEINKILNKNITEETKEIIIDFGNYIEINEDGYLKTSLIDLDNQVDADNNQVIITISDLIQLPLVIHQLKQAKKDLNLQIYYLGLKQQFVCELYNKVMKQMWENDVYERIQIAVKDIGGVPQKSCESLSEMLGQQITEDTETIIVYNLPTTDKD